MRAIAIITFLLTGSAFAQHSQLTLDDAVRLGLEHSRVLKISNSKVSGAALKVREAGAARLPSLKLEAGYRRLSDVDPFQVRVPFYPEPIVLAPTVLNNYNLRVGLLQPLFTGFKLSSNVGAAEFLAGAAAEENRNDAAELVLNITSSYWMLYLALETRSVVEENVRRLESYVKDTEHLLGSGMATKNDLLRIQVQLGSAKLARIDAMNDVQLATMHLNNFMGQPLDAEIALASVPGSGADPEIMKDAPPGEMVELRPDLHAIRLRVRAAEEGLRAVQGNWWPQIYLTSNYYYSRPNVRYQPTRDEFNSTWDVGIQLQLDLWNWGMTGYQAEQARAVLRQNELLYDQLKENASLEVQRYRLSFERAQEKIVVAEVAVEQAMENVRSTNDRYKSGLATSTELLDAEVAELQAKTHHTAAKVEYEVSKARLIKAMGLRVERAKDP